MIADNHLPKKRSRWMTLAAFVLATVLLFLAFRGVDWESMHQTFLKGRGEYLILAFCAVTISYFLRALRWRVLLSAERALPPLTVFWGTAVGYLGNTFLPARAGEIIRSLLIARRGTLSVTYVLATALTERIIDVLALVLFGALSLRFVDLVPDWLTKAAQVMTVMGVIGVAIFFALPRIEKSIMAVLQRLPLSDKWHEQLQKLVQGFLAGMLAFQHGQRALHFGVLTLLVWAMDVIAGMLTASAFSLSLNPAHMMILLAAMGLSSAAPSTPGYVGIYQFVAVSILVPFGLTQDQALVFVLAFQAITVLVVVLFGGIGLWRLRKE